MIVRLYANQIWTGGRDYNGTQPGYIKVKEQVTATMREDVAKGAYVYNIHCTPELFEEITGEKY